MAATIQPVSLHIVQRIRDVIPGLFVRQDARQPEDPPVMLLVVSSTGKSSGHPNPKQEPQIQFRAYAPDVHTAMTNAFAVYNEFLKYENGVLLRAPDNITGMTDLEVDRFALQQEPYHVGVDRETSQHIYLFNAKLTYFPRS